ncbi:hypothetical protein ES332_D13G153100v1 [Gossypium tomentosum]|uniref:Uncharacterized protein n=1 Tax=Gossypium tomentosum TaxID=34277 RepID=A0A5D2HXL0_GOSTO|nr:hypothetical protein ES332_D13G153100v1 [Gossypium tomentosum]
MGTRKKKLNLPPFAVLALGRFSALKPLPNLDHGKAGRDFMAKHEGFCRCEAVRWCGRGVRRRGSCEGSRARTRGRLLLVAVLEAS